MCPLLRHARIRAANRNDFRVVATFACCPTGGATHQQALHVAQPLLAEQQEGGEPAEGVAAVSLEVGASPKTPLVRLTTVSETSLDHSAPIGPRAYLGGPPNCPPAKNFTRKNSACHSTTPQFITRQQWNNLNGTIADLN